MKRFLIPSLLALVAAVVTSDTASAQYPSNLGFLPFGFYQPYGARYGNSIRTPPYFATNPPVYYGARHARPYGLSPFASPPMVSPASNYEGRLRSQFEQPMVPTPQPLCNPCVSRSRTVTPSGKLVASEPAPIKLGAVQTNPYVETVDKIAKNL